MIASGGAKIIVNADYEGAQRIGMKDQPPQRDVTPIIAMQGMARSSTLPAQREERAVRDLLRKRSHLARQRTTQILSIQNLLVRNLNVAASGNLIKGWQAPDIDTLALLPEQALTLRANAAVMHCLDEQLGGLEQTILARAKLREDHRTLQTASGSTRERAPARCRWWRSRR